ncbi:MAG: hypothetical protein R2856_03295 [Caldilineaceae bacterium]
MATITGCACGDKARRRRRQVGNLAGLLVLLFGSAIVPPAFAWMLSTSLKTPPMFFLPPRCEF